MPRRFAASGADFRIGGERAFYSPSHDLIQVPRPEAYFEAINWHRTALHELGHNAERRVMPRRSVFPFEMRSDRRGDAA
jgi:antirestriction protein ArdC